MQIQFIFSSIWQAMYIRNQLNTNKVEAAYVSLCGTLGVGTKEASSW